MLVARRKQLRRGMARRSHARQRYSSLLARAISQLWLVYPTFHQGSTFVLHRLIYLLLFWFRRSIRACAAFLRWQFLQRSARGKRKVRHKNVKRYVFVAPFFICVRSTYYLATTQIYTVRTLKIDMRGATQANWSTKENWWGENQMGRALRRFQTETRTRANF